MSDAMMRRATLAADHAAFSSLLISSPASASRFVLRCADGLAASLAAAGFALPERINRAQTQGGKSALKLGPDEYLLLADEGAAADEATAALARGIAAALGDAPHSLVDISHRQTALVLSGRQAAEVLSCFTPLDLAPEAFPVGMSTRTLFEKAEIVLWRRAPETFHVEVWRSFAPYVLSLLEMARRELG